CRFTPDSRVIVILGATDRENFVDCVDPATGQRPADMSRIAASAVAIDPRGEMLLAASRAALWRWSRGEGESNRFAMTLLRQFSGRDWADMEFGADGAQLAVAHPRRGVAVLLDRTFTNELAQYGPHPGVELVAISPDHRWLATGSPEDRQVKVWDAVTAANL